MGLAIVDKLGDGLEAAWRARDYDQLAFSDIAAAHLEKAALQDELSPDDVIAWVLGADLPQQADPTARFGQPPVTMYRSRRFYISALFWVDGTTTIHDHGFSGAFQVLSGSSIETRFSFQTTRDVDGHLQFGDLSVNGSSLLKHGDVRAVPSGPAYIHSLFHLARPSVSLVVRTFADSRPGVQFDYSPAGTAYDTNFVDETLDRVLQTVELLRKVEHPSFEEKVGTLIAGADLYAAFRIVMACGSIKDRALLGRLVDRVRDAGAGARFRLGVSKAERMSFLIQRRRDIHDPDLRFLLAVLLNAHRRADALSLVSSYASGREPGQQIAAWLRRLSELTARLQVGTTPWQPNLLGLPAFDEELEGALARFLAGREQARSSVQDAFIGRLSAMPALAPLFID